MSRNAFVFGCLLLVAGLTVFGCEGKPPKEGRAQTRRPIVGGTVESGWPSVGALTLMHPAYGYVGSFCTATLIEPQWVLTAGHCLENDVGDIPLTPGIVRFYIGDDARNPSASELHEVDAFYVHDDYSDNPVQNDIALVHLTTPVGGVTPVDINTTAMGGAWVGADLLYVGFGVNDGDQQTGSGVKRSGAIAVHMIYANTYASDATDGVGVCFGDSGGPGLVQMGGVWYVVGVNSTVAGGGQDPCLGYGSHTRVDVYGNWINGITGGQLPDCNDDPNICYCGDACQLDGTCDNSLCEVYDCADINYCMSGCTSGDDGCYVDCYLQGTDEGRMEFDAITQCGLDHNCYEASDYENCMSSHCQNEMDICFEPDTGAASCAELYDCLVDCPTDDNLCTWHCYESGSAQGQQTYDTMAQCFDTQCGNITDEDLWLDCIYDHCPVELEECFPPQNCALTGGECGADAACWPTPGGNTDCYPSDGVDLGQSCDPDLTDRLSCGDGMVCASWEGDICVQLCMDANDCAVDEVCEIPVFQDVDDVGYCTCVDADNDGVCVFDDCRDDDPATYPGATEACGDGVDNDCDGETDENCGDCVDEDADGYCADVDCDDASAAVNPAAAELCGDTIDNDCDGQTDEDCEDCTDNDEDGYCDTLDCNDNDVDIHPNGTEVCHDDIDNDCDGNTDEGCAPCVDDDGDGSCAFEDCDDEDPTANPDSTEVCGDGVDNNCNGAIDENCPGNSKNGGCTISKTGGGPLDMTLLFVLCALGVLFLNRRYRW
jgi:hypothetical protein